MGDFACLGNADNLARSAVLSVTSESPIYGSGNLRKLPVSLPYRTTGISGQLLAIDLAEARAADVLAIVGHNLTPAATIAVGYGATAAEAATPQAGVTLAVGLRRVAHVLLPAPLTHRYWSLTISDAANPAGYLSLGYLVLGRTTALSAISRGWQRQRLKTVRTNENELGIPFVGAAVSEGTRLTVSFSGLTVAEADAVDAFLDSLDLDRIPALLLPEGADTAEPLFARLEAPQTRVREAGYDTIEGVSFVTDHLGRDLAA